MSDGLDVLAAVTAIGCGTVAGVFLTFSTFVMDGLRRLPAAQGLAAMQAINAAAVRPPLLTALFGTGLLCVALVVRGVLADGQEGTVLEVAAAACYLVGAVGVTAARNVPLNDGIAPLDPHLPGSGERWARYRRTWTAWNHVRTVACLASTALLVVAVAS